MSVNNPLRLLFVCTGNICRSPLAEALARHEAGKRGLFAIEVDSAGTHGYHVGERPDPRSLQVARDAGIATDGLVARKVLSADLDGFDLIFGMDSGHVAFLRDMASPAHTEKIHLFLNYAGDVPDWHKGSDVPDPYYGDIQGFEYVLKLLAHGMERVFDRIENPNGVLGGN
jgi:protein-tyrosine phosphatase